MKAYLLPYSAPSSSHPRSRTVSAPPAPDPPRNQHSLRYIPPPLLSSFSDPAGHFMPSYSQQQRRATRSGGGEKSAAMPADALTRQQRADAIAQAKNMLETVGVGWEYTAPPPPRKKKTEVGSLKRTGSLGAWRPRGDTSSEDDDDDDDGAGLYFSSDDDDDDSEDDDMGGGEKGNGSSYRRPETPTKFVVRKVRRKKSGVWRAREEDSDFEPPAGIPAAAEATIEEEVEDEDGLRSPYRFEGPDSIPSPEKIKQRKREMLKAEMEWNDGLRLWIRRRDAWTGANSEGEVRVGESHFKDNPLTKLISPTSYDQIYTKVIVKSLDPPVPINLKDLTNAMVQGWKKDDLWPPKPSRPEPSMRVRPGNTAGGDGGAGAQASTGGSGAGIMSLPASAAAAAGGGGGRGGGNGRGKGRGGGLGVGLGVGGVGLGVGGVKRAFGFG